jgi:VanZ family protein
MNFKKINNIVAYLFIIGGFILLFGKSSWFPDFYNPIFMGVMSLVSAGLIWFPRFYLNPKNEKQEGVVNLIQSGLSFALVIGSLGSLGFFQLYRVGIQYDKITHFLNSFILTIVLTQSLVDWKEMRSKKAVAISVAIVLVCGVLWEGYELLGDTVLGTQMLGHYGEFITEDTIWDLIMNLLGVVFAYFGIKFFFK